MRKGPTHDFQAIPSGNDQRCHHVELVECGVWICRTLRSCNLLAWLYHNNLIWTVFSSPEQSKIKSHTNPVSKPKFLKPQTCKAQTTNSQPQKGRYLVKDYTNPDMMNATLPQQGIVIPVDFIQDLEPIFMTPPTCSTANQHSLTARWASGTGPVTRTPSLAPPPALAQTSRPQ